MKKFFILSAVILSALATLVGCESDSVGPEVTTDSWNEVALPADTIPVSSLHGISFFNENLGWIVGHGGNIFKTTDGGESWELVYREADVWLYDVCSIDNTNVWAAGMYGIYPYGPVLLHSADAGATWSDMTFDVNAQLTSIRFSDSQTGFAVGGGWPVGQANQTILQTFDGGASWELDQCFDCKLCGMDFGAGASGCVVGTGAAIFTYNDADTSWHRCEPPPNAVVIYPEDSSQHTIDLFGVDMVDASVGWCVGSFNVILRTANGGETWTRQHIDSTSFNALRSVSFLDANRGVAVGDGGKVLLTDDAGVTWRDFSYASGHDLTDVEYLTPSKIMVIAEDMLLIASDF